MRSASHVPIYPASGVIGTYNGPAHLLRAGPSLPQVRRYPFAQAGSPVEMRSSKWAPFSGTAVPEEGNWSMTWSSA